MFTSITCPACQHKLTVPESAMGKRQTCPNCHSPFLAGKSVAESEAEISMKLQPSAPSSAPAGFQKTMLGETAPPIKFNCPRCKKPLESSAAEAGIKKPCPECGQRLQVPAAPAPAAGGPNLNKTLLASDESAPQPPIRYNCPSCKKPMESPAIEAGTKKPCPACGQRFQVPAAPPPGSGQPNLNKTIMASDESRPQPAGFQAIPSSSASPASYASPGTSAASQTTPGSVTLSKSTLLVGGGIVAIGLIFVILLFCIVSIFIGSADRKAAADLAAMEAKLKKEQDAAERRAEQEKRDHETKMAEFRHREQMNALIANGKLKAEEDQKLQRDRDDANRRQQDHERELARIRADAASAAAAAAAARPYWYNGGYWYRGHWYPY